jgi:hypothetical protein
LDSMRARCLGARPPPMNSPRYLARRHGVHIAANSRRRVASNVWGFQGSPSDSRKHEDV